MLEYYVSKEESSTTGDILYVSIEKFAAPEDMTRHQEAAAGERWAGAGYQKLFKELIDQHSILFDLNSTIITNFKVVPARVTIYPMSIRILQDDHIDIVISHIISPYPMSISMMTISIW